VPPLCAGAIGGGHYSLCSFADEVAGAAGLEALSRLASDGRRQRLRLGERRSCREMT